MKQKKKNKLPDKKGFDLAIRILQEGARNGTLARNTLCGCAVGHLLAHFMDCEVRLEQGPYDDEVLGYWLHRKTGQDVEAFWRYHEDFEFMERSQENTEKALQQIRTSPYTVEHLIMLDECFENDDALCMHDRIENVVTALVYIHDMYMDTEEIEQISYSISSLFPERGWD